MRLKPKEELILLAKEVVEDFIILIYLKHKRYHCISRDTLYEIFSHICDRKGTSFNEYVLEGSKEVDRIVPKEFRKHFFNS